MKTLKFFAFAFLFLSICIFSVGCKNSAADDAYDVSNTEWQLESINGTPPLAQSAITLSFSDDQVSGSAGCNSYSGGYQQDGSQLTIGPLMSTLMACVDSAMMQQETDFLEALSSIESVTATEDQLTLTTATGSLVFIPVPAVENKSLEGALWQLSGFESGEIAQPALIGSSVTIEFSAGQVSGNAGCNSFSGGYSLNENQLTFTALMNTEMACVDSDIMQQENEFLQALRSAESVSIEGNTLRITHPTGALVFSAE